MFFSVNARINHCVRKHNFKILKFQLILKPSGICVFPQLISSY